MNWFAILLLIVVILFVFYFIFQPSPQVSSVQGTQISATSMEGKYVDPPVDMSSEESLKQFYYPAQDKVELDYPPKKIGCCPFSKPFSKDLPIGNVPMCYAKDSKAYLSS
jgi:hypothetical protein